MPTHKGFTLVELLVVIAIIAVLSVIGVTVYTGIQKNVRVSKATSDLRTLSQSYTRYYIENSKPPPFDHSWSMNGEDCTLDSGNFTPKPASWNGPYYSKIPTNSWGGEYHFEHGVFFPYSISLHKIPQSEALALDKAIDDNNLSTGILRQSNNPIGDERYEYNVGTDWDSYHEHFTSCIL